MPYGMGVKGACKVDLKLEILVLPVADVDRAKAFTNHSASGWMPMFPETTASGW
jgi:hypothetical protein